VATAVASIFGAPANTTYGENTGVLNLTIADIVGIFLNAIMPVKLGMKVKSFKGKEKT